MSNVEVNDTNIDGLNRISKNLSQALIRAFEFAKRRGGDVLDPKDIFLGIIVEENNIASRLLEKLGVDLKATAQTLLTTYGEIPVAEANPVFGEQVKQLLTNAYLISNELNHVYVGTEHMLLAILKLKDLDIVQDLAKMGFNYDFVRQSVLNFGIYQPGIFTKGTEKVEEEEQQQSSLSFFARDMNKLAKQGKYLKVWGRDAEIERLIHILSRRTKNNPILVGEAGVGKTAIVEGLVQRILQGKVPRSFRNKKIVQLDLSAIIAGSKIRGDVEERLLSIVGEMAENKDLVLFIDEIHMIVGAGAAGSGNSMDIANIIKPYLTNGDLRVIGATTYDEYQKFFEEDDALARRFQPIMVDEISADDAEKAMKMLRPGFEEFHHVRITDEALHEAVVLSDRYIISKYLPDKAIDVLDEAASAKKIALEKNNTHEVDYKQELEDVVSDKNAALDKGDLQQAADLRKEEVRLRGKIGKLKDNDKISRSKKALVDVEDIRKVISSWSKVPLSTLSSTDVKALQNLEVNLTKRIIGQEDAVHRVAGALKRARIGISDAQRPMASFLFLGPTGVGKTETAKVVAKTLFGSEDALIQVDMSEYMEQHSVSKLIGSPPGYVGYQEGGQLTERIKRKPYSVVLFDEIEKAHPELLSILLQILDEGHLQDSKGRMVNFKNSIIIMTSNIGAAEISKDSILGFRTDVDQKPGEKKVDVALEQVKSRLIERLKDVLPPEFINRIDDVVVFKGLDQEDIRKITRLLITDINKRLKEKGIQIVPTPSVVNYIAEEGFSKDYGARNIKRKLQEFIENPLADFMLDSGIRKPEKDKQLLIKVEKDKKGITFSK